MNQPMWHWEVQIQGGLSDLDHLVRHFAAGHTRVTRDERDDSFLYQSDSFRTCTTSEEVLQIAEGEFAVLSGVLKFARGSRELLRAGAVYKRHSNGSRDVFVHIHDSIQVCVEMGEVTVSVTDAEGNVIHRPSPPPRTVSISALVVRDEAVKRVMRLIAAPDANTWVGLYRMHEVIESDVGGERSLKKRGWGSAQDLKRFKHSANSVSVAGDKARHGKEHEQPPANPMTIDEAEAYVNYVQHAWLATKGA